jgi:hypothetical protein
MMWSPFGPKYPERHPEDVDTREYDYVIVGGLSHHLHLPLFLEAKWRLHSRYCGLRPSVATERRPGCFCSGARARAGE